MIRRKIIAITTTCALLVSPVFAQELPGFTTENISKGVGAIAGALVGSQIGGGRGKLAAVAAGTLAGYWVGGNVGRYLSQADRTGIAQTTSKAVYSGQNTSWHNPDTGMKTSVTVRDINSKSTSKNLKAALSSLPTIELINSFYQPVSNVNVRGGPGTEYQIVHRITAGQAVPVIGKVINRDWYLIAEQGKAAGFVYAPLMKRQSGRNLSANAIREASTIGQPGRYLAKEQHCRVITQQVQLPNGASESHQFKACQHADGNWVKV